MSLSAKGRVLGADMEAVGLLPAIRENDPTSLHCICVEDVGSGEKFTFFDEYEDRDPANREWLDAEGEQDGTLIEGLKFLRGADNIIMQNSSGFDYLAFEKVFPDVWHKDYRTMRGKESIFSYKHIDTLVMSQLLNPERRPPKEAYELGLNCGGHSIEAHGVRIGRYKPENTDWSKLTDHMLHRCREDVSIGIDFYFYLRKEWDKQVKTKSSYTGLSIADAYGVDLMGYLIIARQAQRGFPVDADLMHKTALDLKAQCDAIESEFRPHMPKRIKLKKLSTDQRRVLVEIEHKMFEGECMDSDSLMTEEGVPTHGSYYTTVHGLTTKAGTFKKAVTKWFPDARGKKRDHTNLQVQGDFTPLLFEDIPLGNREEVKKILHAQGWIGVTYNDTEQELIDDGLGETLPPWAGKIDEKSLEAWEARGNVPAWCRGIASWYILRSRQTQLLNFDDMSVYDLKDSWPQQNGKDRARGILLQCFNKETGETVKEFYEKSGDLPKEGDWRAPAIAFYNATNTFRMRHKILVNIPSKGLSPLRHLFTGTSDMMVIGCDASGIELRMLAHFMNDREYIDTLLKGDIHTYNQMKAGLTTRDIAKVFIYAFLYGSGVFNLSKICGYTEKHMGQVLEQFKEQLPALSNLIEGVKKAGERQKYLLSLDGRRGRMRFKGNTVLVHTSLNVLLQMAASLCMKYALVMADETLKEEGVMLDENGEPQWIANVHDEFQGLVHREDVEEISYEVDDWKAEEKREHFDSTGRMYSAPKRVGGADESGKQRVIRRYHPAGQILAESIKRAGEVFGLRLPLAGEYLIGESWAETH